MTTKKDKDVSGRKPDGIASPEAPAAGEPRRPIKTFREGGCSASIWARTRMVRGTELTYYSLTLERSYKDRDGAWRYTRTFDIPDSLGAIVKLCQQCSEYAHSLQYEAPETGPVKPV